MKFPVGRILVSFLALSLFSNSTQAQDPVREEFRHLRNFNRYVSAIVRELYQIRMQNIVIARPVLEGHFRGPSKWNSFFTIDIGRYPGVNEYAAVASAVRAAETRGVIIQDRIYGHVAQIEKLRASGAPPNAPQVIALQQELALLDAERKKNLALYERAHQDYRAMYQGTLDYQVLAMFDRLETASRNLLHMLSLNTPEVQPFIREQFSVVGRFYRRAMEALPFLMECVQQSYFVQGAPCSFTDRAIHDGILSSMALIDRAVPKAALEMAVLEGVKIFIPVAQPAAGGPVVEGDPRGQMLPQGVPGPRRDGRGLPPSQGYPPQYPTGPGGGVDDRREIPPQQRQGGQPQQGQIDPTQRPQEPAKKVVPQPRKQIDPDNFDNN